MWQEILPLTDLLPKRLSGITGCIRNPLRQSIGLSFHTLNILFILLFLPLASPAQDQRLVNIGMVTGLFESENSFSPFENYLNSQMPGYRFQVQGYDTESGLMNAIRQDRLDFALIPPAPYVELNLENRLRVLLTITQSANDTFTPFLAGAVFTRADRDDIGSLADARNKSVVALSEYALGGWLSAAREWNDLGIDTDTNMNPEYTYSYAPIIDAVCSGDADIGVINALALPTYARQCEQALKVLPSPSGDQGIPFPLPRSTRLYPQVAFTMLRQQNEEFIRQLTRVLLDIEHDTPAVAAMNLGGFTAPLPYDEMVALMRELNQGPFSSPVQLTLRQVLEENIVLVTLVLVAIISVISLALLRARRLSKKLRESDNYQKSVFEGSRIPMVIVDQQNMTFHDMNPAAVKQYGYDKKEELIGKPLMSLSSEKQDIAGNIPKFFEDTKNTVHQEGQATFTWNHIKPNGEKWIARIHLMRFDTTEGRLVQATVEDITDQLKTEEERKYLQQQVEFSQRMESIGRLAGGIAHDFNNLLTVINGYCEVLLNDKNNSGIQNILEQIRKAGVRASDLTQQLLTFSRKQVTRKVTLDLNHTIDESAEMISSVLGENIQLDLQLSRRDCKVLSDQGQLQQILLNLVVNAKDAMPNGGILTITTRPYPVEPAEARTLKIEAGNYVEMKVTDTGIGMTENIKQHIFEPFFSTKDNAGTGLGLSTVYGIVNQSNGMINVTSKPGAGSSFRLLLPESEEVLQSLPEEKFEITPVLTPHRILVVEDQDDIRDYICSVLNQAGYNVYSANSGQQALSVIDSLDSPLQLLITDVVMEGISGGELADRFNEISPGVPVLFISGYAADEIARHGVQDGSREFLAKPFSPKDLLKKIEEVISATGLVSL